MDRACKGGATRAPLSLKLSIRSLRILHRLFHAVRLVMHLPLHSMLQATNVFLFFEYLLHYVIPTHGETCLFDEGGEIFCVPAKGAAGVQGRAGCCRSSRRWALQLLSPPPATKNLLPILCLFPPICSICRLAEENHRAAGDEPPFVRLDAAVGRQRQCL